MTADAADHDRAAEAPTHRSGEEAGPGGRAEEGGCQQAKVRWAESEVGPHLDGQHTDQVDGEHTDGGDSDG